ncbi:MAG: VC0807 family protein, partial [Dermatophilaceae bacterium]
MRARVVPVAGHIVTGLLLPVASYYALRALGVSVYAALLASAVVSAAPTARTLVMQRRLDGLSAYFTAMVFGSVAVALVSGSTQFLLARDAALTAVTGVWFLASVRARRPLAYLFSRPFAEGRLRWPSDWESLWAHSPRFRQMWQVASVLWGVGTLADATARVAMAYTLPPDSVPGLSTVLYAVTTAVLLVGTNAYYVRCGVFDPRSPMRRSFPRT